MSDRVEKADRTDKRDAPWYVYVITIVAANLIKQQFMDGVPLLVNLAVTAVLVLAIIGSISTGWRLVHSRAR